MQQALGNTTRSNQLQDRLLDHLTTAIILVDRKLRLRYVNSAAEMLLELSGTRVVGRSIHQLFLENGKPLASMSQTLHDGSPYTKRQASLTLPSGNCISVDYTVTPVKEQGDEYLIMEFQPLDRMLKISREANILSSQQTSRALIRGLAHEIKNPLGGLRGAAQLLAKELPDDALQEYTDVIIAEADRLRKLVDRLLGPHQLAQHKPLNIHEVLERVVSLVKAECGGSIEFQRNYDPSIPNLHGDKSKLIQATLNIVRNAMQAFEGQAMDFRQIHISTRVLRQFTIGDKRHRLVCRVDIDDNGPGIPADLQQTIFFPMVSGKPSGTGLGLSIAQSILNQHQGLIECNSEPGATRFTLFIPLDQASGACP